MVIVVDNKKAYWHLFCITAIISDVQNMNNNDIVALIFCNVLNLPLNKMLGMHTCMILNNSVLDWHFCLARSALIKLYRE